MSEPVDTTQPRPERRESFWRGVVIPTARGLERFMWRVAWFAVLIYYLLS